jgi:hypothetical protein
MADPLHRQIPRCMHKQLREVRAALTLLGTMSQHKAQATHAFMALAEIDLAYNTAKNSVAVMAAKVQRLEAHILAR